MHTDTSMEKRYALTDDAFLGADEQRSVVLAAGPRGLEVDDRLSRGQVKTAAAEEAIAEALTIKPVKGRIYLLVVGLGARESWGDNNNGDAFPRNALLGLPPADVVIAFFDRYKSRIKPGWGYKTFLKGHVFQEHRNTNPTLAIGGIHATFWNNRMQRVENLIWIDRVKGKKWADRADAGGIVGTSMACRVPFDRCSVCGNLAPTRNQYCVHLKPRNPLFELRKIRDDGTSVAMINDFPHFFDESCVETPAAPEALQIMKVASANTLPIKGAATKLAEIKKTGPDLPVDVLYDDFHSLYGTEAPIPSMVLEQLRQYNLPEVVEGFKSAGMALRPSELFTLCFGDQAIAPKLASIVDAAVLDVEPNGQGVHVAQDKMVIKAAGLVNPNNVARVRQLIAPFIEKRSYDEPYFTKRLWQSYTKRASVSRVFTPPDELTTNLLRVYHGLYKHACGEYGYGLTHVNRVHEGYHGSL
jgi:hypothetical protein